MRVVQGTQVRLDVTVTGIDNGRPTDPITLVCRIQDPTGGVTDQDLAELERLAQGRYRAIMDTTPWPSTWTYEFIANDTLQNIVRGTIDVTPAIPAPVG